MLYATFCVIGAVTLLTSPRTLAVELDCLIKPEMYVELSSPVNSVIDEILVNVGDTVTLGQPLAKLESSVEVARLKLARLNARSQNEIQHRKEQLRYAQSYLKRINNLLKQNSISQYEKDKAATEVALAEIELRKAQEKWSEAQLNLDLARTQLALKTITSPINGVVVDRYAMVGESVRDRTIMKLAQVDPLKVELIVPTDYFGRIRKGMQVEVFPEKPANQMFMATVSVVDRLVDPASGSFTVSMTLPNPDERLVGGVNCIANLRLDAVEPFNNSQQAAPSKSSKDGTFGLALSHSLSLGQ